MRSRLALSGNFRALAFSALMLAACSPGGRNTSPSISPSPVREILNVRQLNSIGPEIGSLGKLIEPASITINNIGEIFIADRAINVVYKLSANLEPLAREGGLGGSTGGFNRPMGISSDAALNIYIADATNHQILIFDRNLRFAKSVGSYEIDNGETVELGFPADLAIDKEGNFWVADEDRVLKLDPFFRLIFEASQKAAGYFILGRVSSIDISKSGIVAISDAGNRRLILMSIHGNYIGEISSIDALDIAWDLDNNIWAVESGRGRVSCFNSNGALIYALGNDGGARPVSVAIDGNGRLLLLDGNQRRIKTYEIIRGIGGSGSR